MQWTRHIFGMVFRMQIEILKKVNASIVLGDNSFGFFIDP